MRSLIVKLFGLDDISDMIYRAREQERRRVERDMGVKMRQQREILERQKNLELQGKQAEIALLEKRISQMECAEKEVRDLEYTSKKQIKENYRVATELAMQIKTFTLSINNIFGEILGIQNTVQKHQKTIQE